MVDTDLAGIPSPFGFAPLGGGK